MANITTQTIRVDLSTGKVIPTAYTHQNDTARTLVFDMYNGGLPYTMTGNTVKFAYKSPVVDGQYSVIAGSSMANGTVSGNKVTVALPVAYTKISGVGLLTMIITPSSGTIRPVNVRLVVQKSADGDDSVAGASDMPDYLAEVAEQYYSEYVTEEVDALRTCIINNSLDISDAFGTAENLFYGALKQGIVNSSGNIGTDSVDVRSIVFDRKVPVTGGSTVTAELTYKTEYPRYAKWAQFDSNGNLLTRGEGSGTNIKSSTHQYYATITVSNDCAYVQPYFQPAGSTAVLNASDYTQAKLYYGSSIDSLVDVVPNFNRSEGIHLFTSTAQEICNNDLNNLPNNRHYAVNITDGSLANAPLTEMTGRIVTYGKDTSRSVGDIQLFYHTSGSVYYRIYWSSAFVWKNINGILPLKILACGDSICRGARNNYKGFVGDLGVQYKNIGVGDATLSNVNTSVTNIPDALVAETSYSPDIIIADGGINDYHYEASLGNIPTEPVTSDASAELLDRNTVMGGICYLFYQMIKKFPNAQRFFVVTHKTYWNTNSAKDGYCPTRENTKGYTQKDLHDAIVSACNVYGVKVIDVYTESMVNSAFTQYRSPVSWDDDRGTAEQYMVDADGVHPTELGAKVLAARFLSDFPEFMQNT